MAQPRFKQYTGLSPDAQKKKAERAVAGRKFRSGCIIVLVLALIVIAALAAVRRLPIKSSLDGVYAPPRSREGIPDFSRARWFLHDAHEKQLAVDIAWYHNVTLDIPGGVNELDQNGFRPFLFIDQAGNEISILNISVDPESNPATFLLALLTPTGTSSSFLSRKTELSTNILGDTWNDSANSRITINSDSDISIHGQFLPENPELPEQYVSFLAQVWETAAASYIQLYQKPPDSLEDLLDGIGLIPNPACAWPLDDYRRINVNCEGGLIEGKIVYWTVTMPDGETHGQARYWDQYTSYDDASTPDSIITREVTSVVVDPRYVPGTREVMFSMGIMKNRLDWARASAAEEDR